MTRQVEATAEDPIVTEAGLQHLVLTRLNVPPEQMTSSPFPPHRNLDPDWLSYRLDLLERLCLPSLAEQTSRNFRWLVLADERTPTPFRRRITELIRSADVTSELQWLDHFSVQLIRRLVQERLRQPPPAKLLTTRLDTDDALSRTFVADTQSRAAAVRQLPYFINFRQGYQLDLASGLAVNASRRSSQFSTLVEAPGDGVTTVFCGLPHPRYGEFAPIEQVESVGWLLVTHEQNVSSSLRPGRIVPRGAVKRHFEIDPTVLGDGRDLGFEVRRILGGLKAARYKIRSSLRGRTTGEGRR